MTSPPLRLPFAGAQPGQDLAELVQRFTQQDLSTLLGPQVMALVESLPSASDSRTALRRVVVTRLRENLDELLRRPDVRAVCLGALSAAKRDELTSRTGVEENALANPDFPGPTDSKTWHRFLEFFGFDPRHAASPRATPDRVSLPSAYGLFPHQRRTVRHVNSAILPGRTRVVLHMPTGSGKTRTAMHAICGFLTSTEPCPVVWLASSGELLEQAADAFEHAWKHLGDRDLDLFRLWGRHTPDLSSFSDGVLVASFQKLHALHARDPIAVLRLARPIRLVVVDEAHQAVAPTYGRLVNLLADTGHPSALLGLTATPGRTYSDIDADARLADFFGRNKIMLDVENAPDPISFLAAEGYLARPKFRRIEYLGSHDFDTNLLPGLSRSDYDPRALNVLAEQTKRSQQIVSEVEHLVRNGHTRIIVFSTSAPHAGVLATALEVLGISASAVTANTPPTTRQRIITKFRTQHPQPMVICNYGVLTTGFDAPRTSAAVIARPTRSLVLFSQMLGRATRGPKAGGNETCEVVTVVDLDLPGFGDLSKAFTNWEDVWND